MIYGLEALELPEGYIALEAVAVIKALDANGEVELLLRSTNNLSGWESAGMLDVAHATQRDLVSASFVSEDEDEDDG